MKIFSLIFAIVFLFFLNIENNAAAKQPIKGCKLYTKYLENIDDSTDDGAMCRRLEIISSRGFVLKFIDFENIYKTKEIYDANGKLDFIAVAKLLVEYGNKIKDEDVYVVSSIGQAGISINLSPKNLSRLYLYNYKFVQMEISYLTNILNSSIIQKKIQYAANLLFAVNVKGWKSKISNVDCLISIDDGVSDFEFLVNSKRFIACVRLYEEFGRFRR